MPKPNKELDNSFTDLEKIVQESKDREERIRIKLERLRNQAKLVAKKKNNFEDHYKTENSLAVQEKLSECENKLNAFKDTMENILNLSKKTHEEVKSTKGIIESLQTEPSNFKNSSSFQSNFLIDQEEGYENCRKIPEEGDGIRSPTKKEKNFESIKFPTPFSPEDPPESVDGMHKEYINKKLIKSSQKLIFYEKKLIEKNKEKEKREQEALDIRRKIAQLQNEEKDISQIQYSSIISDPSCATCANNKEGCVII